MGIVERASSMEPTRGRMRIEVSQGNMNSTV